MSSRFLNTTGAVAIAAMLALSSQAFAQSDDADAEMRIQRLENQLRQLTGQNEELQYRNRQLEERLRQLGGAAAVAPTGQPPIAQPSVAAAQPNPPLRQPQAQPGYPQAQPGYPQTPPGYPQQPGYDQQQIAAPAPIAQEPAAPQPGGRRRGDAFDPNQNPNAPGAPRALGGGQLPVANEAPVGAPGGRGPGEPLDLSATSPRDPGGALPPPRGPGASAALTTLPPSATPRDEFDLGIGYIRRRDYALAEETMKNFAQKYPRDALVADFAVLAWRKLFPAPAISRCRGSLSRGDHQVRQIGQGAGRVAAARPVAGGAEGKGSRLRRPWRGDAEISGRFGWRQSSRRP